MKCKFCKQKVKYELETIFGWWFVCTRHKNKWKDHIGVRQVKQFVNNSTTLSTK